MVAANFGEQDIELELSKEPVKLLLSNVKGKVLSGTNIKLKTCEVNVILMNE